jgi:hypothetical protein
MPAIDWTPIYNKYKGRWVGLAKDEVTVLVAGDSLKEAMEEARKKAIEKPSYMRVPENLDIAINII